MELLTLPHWQQDDSCFCLFTALWRNDDFKGFLPFWWMDNADSFGIFPLYWHINIRGNLDMLFPLYGYWPEKGRNVDLFFIPVWR